MKFEVDDLTRPEVVALIEHHLTGMDENSPPGTSYALDVAALNTPDVTFYSAWDGSRLCAIGAIKALSPKWGELKSMRVHPDFARQGRGRALLEYLVDVARQRGYSRLSLETGTTPAFHPSIELYARNGFVLGEGYADYVPSPFNIFMHKDL